MVYSELEASYIFKLLYVLFLTYSSNDAQRTEQIIWAEKQFTVWNGEISSIPTHPKQNQQQKPQPHSTHTHTHTHTHSKHN